MKKATTIILNLIFITFFVTSVFVFAPAETAAGSLWDKQIGTSNYASTFGSGTGAPTDPRVIVVRVIKLFLTFLGIIMTFMIIWAGYVWMTAQGNSDKVDKAKSTINRAVIGMVIVIMSYFLTRFVSECATDIINNTSGFFGMCT